MSAEPKASELVARLRRSAAGGERAESEVARDEAVEVGEPPAQAPLPLPAVEPTKRVRFTLDLAWAQHRYLKRFALDQEADASEVMRTLLLLLQQDEQVAAAVRLRLAARP